MAPAARTRLKLRPPKAPEADAARAKARAAYQDFFALWIDADPGRAHPETSQSRIRQAAIASGEFLVVHRVTELPDLWAS
jgi:hypothetical protein